VEFNYTERDVILYALGAGAQRNDLDLVYENNENFMALPTYGVVPGLAATMSISMDEFLPSFNPMMLLHGEQYLQLEGPLPTSARLVSKIKVLDVLDKGSGAAVTVGVHTHDADSGKLLFYNEGTTFIRGLGKFNGPTARSQVPYPAAVAKNDPPKRNPDAIVQEKTSERMAAIYRLSGDYNPLHIDPEMSKMGGFDVPILHGLGTCAVAGKHVLRTMCNNDPSLFKSIKVRFAKHVFPGETLETLMWKEGNRVIFQVRVVERNVYAITNAAVELRHGGKAKL